MNALYAIAVAGSLGLAPDVIAAGLAAATGSRWRLELERRADGVVVLNDVYNANPTSMAARAEGTRRVARDRSADRGARRHARARRRVRGRARRGRRARGTAGRRRHRRGGGGWRADRRRRGRDRDARSGSPTRRPRSPPSTRCCAAATSCCSRPAARSASSASPTGCSANVTGVRRRDRTVPRGRRVVRLHGHDDAVPHPLPAGAPHRPADPRRRADPAPAHQEDRHPEHGWLHHRRRLRSSATSPHTCTAVRASSTRARASRCSP